MTKICLIVIWMGPFNDTFRLWFDSARRNSTIDFYVFTDQTDNLPNADNVIFIYKSLSDVKGEFEKELGLKINLKHPYKLCDYKPFWWILMGEKINQYDFYGHCDVDLVFGDIRHFLTEDLLQRYDKLFDCGYLILYRNTDEMRNLFKKSAQKDNMAYSYKKVVKTGYACYFDEFMGMSILNWKYHPGLVDQTKEEYLQDFSWKRLDFNSYITHKSFVFHIDNGKVYEINVDDNGIITDDLSSGYKGKEFLLVHIQKREMKINLDLSNEEALNDYWIYPNEYSKEMPKGILYTQEEKEAYAEKIRISDKKKQWKNLRKNGIIQYIPHYLISRKIKKFIRSEKGYF